MLALLLPLISYFIVKRQSEKTVIMPRHYLPDSTITKTIRGKKETDTVWHTLADFRLFNQMGQWITWNDLKGKIVIADFFFTRCPTICPALTRNMKRLQESINNGQKVGDQTNKLVHFLSFSIDPNRDSVQRLKFWADKYQINPEKWWLLSGDKKTIYTMITEEMKIPFTDGEGVDTSFLHTDHFVLIDSNRHVRGYYHGLDSTSLAQLSEDIVMLTLEKSPNEKSFLAGKLQLIAVVFLLTILGVGLFLFFFRKNRK